MDSRYQFGNLSGPVACGGSDGLDGPEAAWIFRVDGGGTVITPSASTLEPGENSAAWNWLSPTLPRIKSSSIARVGPSLTAGPNRWPRASICY